MPLDGRRSTQACLYLDTDYVAIDVSVPTVPADPQRLQPPVTAEWIRLDPPGAGSFRRPPSPPGGGRRFSPSAFIQVEDHRRLRTPGVLASSKTFRAAGNAAGAGGGGGPKGAAPPSAGAATGRGRPDRALPPVRSGRRHTRPVVRSAASEAARSRKIGRADCDMRHILSPVRRRRVARQRAHRPGGKGRHRKPRVRGRKSAERVYASRPAARRRTWEITITKARAASTPIRPATAGLSAHRHGGHRAAPVRVAVTCHSGRLPARRGTRTNRIRLAWPGRRTAGVPP